MDQDEIKEIENTTRELLQKITAEDFELGINNSQDRDYFDVVGLKNLDTIEIKENKDQNNSNINLDIKIKEPQLLIGHNGQTLFDLQRILRIMLNKKLKKVFYLNLDINSYKKKKVEYLKNLAEESANEVSFFKKKKILSPMSSYERRIIHMELANRQGIVTESQGSGPNRYIVISPPKDAL